MFTSYCDAAGGKEHGFTVVSGWVASLQQWDRFESDWKLLLASYNLPYFHMKKCSQWEKPFDTWDRNEAKRAKFLSLCVDVIRSHVRFGVTCIVRHDVWNRVSERYYLKEKMGNPYAFAGRDCAAQIDNHLVATTNDKTLPEIDYIFEDGDEGKGFLIKSIKRDLGRSPKFEPSKDAIHKKTGRLIRGVVQLQAADFAAYELRKAHVDDPLDTWLPSQHRKSIQALARIPAWWGKYTEEDLIRFCKAAGIPERKK